MLQSLVSWFSLSHNSIATENNGSPATKKISALANVAQVIRKLKHTTFNITQIPSAGAGPWPAPPQDDTPLRLWRSGAPARTIVPPE